MLPSLLYTCGFRTTADAPAAKGRTAQNAGRGHASTERVAQPEDESRRKLHVAPLKEANTPWAGRELPRSLRWQIRSTHLRAEKQQACNLTTNQRPTKLMKTSGMQPHDSLRDKPTSTSSRQAIQTTSAEKPFATLSDKNTLHPLGRLLRLFLAQ